MKTKHHKNANRYRTMRSAILTGSLLSILPLVVIMRNGAPSTSTALAASPPSLAVAAGSVQTTSVQAGQTSTSAPSTASTRTTTTTTHTKTKAS